jgi:phosphoglycolate phosphatase-like HAD superfamily hydrolase
MIGDRITDVQCGKNAGAEGILVLTGVGYSQKEETLSLYPDAVILNRYDEILKYLHIV